MDAFLDRFSYSSEDTEGKLSAPGMCLATIERPWIPSRYPGGKPYESCVPDGVYDMVLWESPSKGWCFRLSNPSLGVYETEEEANGKGRFLILVHVGNWMDDVVGCIAPGKSRGVLDGRRAVTDSGAAMRMLLESLDDENTLTIGPISGAYGRKI